MFNFCSRPNVIYVGSFYFFFAISKNLGIDKNEIKYEFFLFMFFSGNVENEWKKNLIQVIAIQKNELSEL